jgi:hypothetical protein
MIMFDEVKNASQLLVGLIIEILFHEIIIRVDRPPRKFFCWGAVVLLCRDAALRCNTL